MGQSDYYSPPNYVWQGYKRSHLTVDTYIKKIHKAFFRQQANGTFISLCFKQEKHVKLSASEITYTVTRMYHQQDRVEVSKHTFTP